MSHGIHFGGSGMFRQLMSGKKKYGSSWLPKRRSRHRSAQMKFWGGKKGKAKLENNFWSIAAKPRDGWGKIFK